MASARPQGVVFRKVGPGEYSDLTPAAAVRFYEQLLALLDRLQAKRDAAQEEAPEEAVNRLRGLGVDVVEHVSASKKHRKAARASTQA